MAYLKRKGFNNISKSAGNIINIIINIFLRTALHWACKRGHKDIVEYLLYSGADPSIMSNKGETPSTVATEHRILKLFQTETLEQDMSMKPSSAPSDSQLPIIPNYLKNPPFPYSDTSLQQQPPLHLNNLRISDPASGDGSESDQKSVNSCSNNDLSSGHAKSCINGSEITIKSLTIKVRIADSGETDFVEVDVHTHSYIDLVRSICEELEISPDDVSKIRKLPNVLIRKDRDVGRLENGQELELVLIKEAVTS